MDRSQAELDDVLSLLPSEKQRTIRHGCQTGAWLTSLPSTVNGTELSLQEFWDSLNLRYTWEIPDHPFHCGSCGKKFLILHTLECKKGGLIDACHNEVRDELEAICSQEFTPLAVCNEPTINVCCTGGTNASSTGSSDAAPPATSVDEERGDLLVCSFWHNGMDVIIDVRFTNTDTKSYQ